MGHDRSDHRACCLILKPTVVVIPLCGHYYNGNMYSFQLCMVFVHNQDFYEVYLDELLLYMRIKKLI